jgi:hypothetical protein
MANERVLWAADLVEAAKQSGLWEPEISVAKLAKRIEDRIEKAYGDRQITRWLKADPKYKTPDSDVRTRVLRLLAYQPGEGLTVRVVHEPDPRQHKGEIPTFTEPIEKSDALWRAVMRAQSTSELMAKQMAHIRAILEAPVSDGPSLPPATPAEVAAFQKMVDEGRASGSTEPAVPAPRRTRR